MPVLQRITGLLYGSITRAGRHFAGEEYRGVNRHEHRLRSIAAPRSKHVGPQECPVTRRNGDVAADGDVVGCGVTLTGGLEQITEPFNRVAGCSRPVPGLVEDR